MLKHNLILAYRNLTRYRSSFLINLIGLASGLASVLLIYLWVMDELSFDRFHENKILQVMERRQFSDRVDISDESSGMLAETIAAEAPEVIYATSIAPSAWFQKFTLSIGERNVKASGQYAGKDYFNIFSFPLIHGDKSQVLADKNSIAISRDLAIKLFNTTENVIGKAVEFQHEREFLVSGIFENLPVNSTEQFDFVLSFEYFKDIQSWVATWDRGNTGPHNYVVLKNGSDRIAFDRKIADVIKKHSIDTYRTAFSLPFADNYLYNRFDHGSRLDGRIEYVRLFSAIALFILAIACINFMNLSTARATRKMKEVGIKKTVGASRQQIARQFLGESLMLTLVAVFFAIAAVSIILPSFNILTGKNIVLCFTPEVIGGIGAISLFTGIMAGSYPAFYLSGFRPSEVLKGKLITSLSEVWARRGLVIFQFVLSIILIVAVVVVYKQIEFVQNKNIGYNKDNLIRFDSEGKVINTQESFLAGLKNIHGVVNASGTFHNIVGRNYSTADVSWEGKNPDEVVFFEGAFVGYDFIPTLEMTLAEGRNFSKEFGDERNKVILNETAVKVMGLKDPIGKTVKIQGDRQVIGVLKDFHFESLHQPVMPMYLSLSTQGSNSWYKIVVKIEREKEKETIESIEKYYAQYNPGFTLDYAYLDEAYQKQYVSEQRVAVLSKYFAGIAILISCLGLFGLTAFTAERRRKEIGIRKVLGSTEWGIIYLLSSDFTKMVLMSIFIALPLSYFLALSWLHTFAYRMDMNLWLFVFAGIAALLIAWITVSLQTYRAARISPTKCLKEQ